MKQYLDLVADVLENGKPNEVSSAEVAQTNTLRQDRTGVGTYSVFGRQLRFDLSKGFPLLTTKKVHLRSIIVELLWFLRGETSTHYLHQHQVTIWDEWASPEGELGAIYGKQWRAWEGPQGRVDQIARLVEGLKRDPYSRRHIVIAFNPADLPPVAPPACHTLFQLYYSDGRLSLQLYQRSADLMLGVPFNIASYSLFLLMLAQVSGYRAHEFIHTFGDVHIYGNHIEGAREQLQRPPRSLPVMKINPEVKSIFEFSPQDFTLERYDPHPHIKFDIAV